jgi:hypothetical protein
VSLAESYVRRRPLGPAVWGALLAMAPLLAGCMAESGEDDARFAVAASLVESCSEAGLLAAPPSQTLHVWLRQVTTRTMHWDDGGGRLVGSYDPTSRLFVIERQLTVDMRAAGSVEPPCSIVRSMRIEGTLDSAPVESAAGFEGVQRIDYLPTDGSSCDDLLEGDVPVAASLPCAVAYDLVAERE